MLSVSQSEALELIEENDIKFIRLAFCDAFGNQKNISIQSSELERAFSAGIAFDGSAIRGFQDPSCSDLLLFPDASTFVLLPWRPSRGGVARFFCDICNPDGTPFAGDCRHYLLKTEKLCARHNLCVSFGSECEFYLFKCDENGLPTDTPLDRAGYFDIAPADRGENVRREICMTLEEMGLLPERSHHEQGPGQNEIDFRYSTALHAADDVITFKQVVSTVAARNGLWASFLPKPLPDEPGNGLHINVSITSADTNNELDETTRHAFMAGLMEHAPEITAVLNPLENSYERLGKDKAPNRVSWSPSNRSQLIRIPAASANPRMELRSPDAAANPYLAFALVMQAGLDGILRGLTPPPPCFENLLSAPQNIREQYPALPLSLESARAMLRGSDFLRGCLPEQILRIYAGEAE